MKGHFNSSSMSSFPLFSAFRNQLQSPASKKSNQPEMLKSTGNSDILDSSPVVTAPRENQLISRSEAVNLGPKKKKKTHRTFKNYHAEWMTTLKKSLLPHLRRAMTSSSSPAFLSTAVDAVHHHFQAYYDEMDRAVVSGTHVAEMLYPHWRNPLEKPFLWIGDFHPYLFTNLLRSFLEDEDSDEDYPEISGFRDHVPWRILTAWKGPSVSLTPKVDRIECRMRLMVPSLTSRVRNAQAQFVERVGFEWRRRSGKKEETEAAMEEGLDAEMDVLVSVFQDANGMRKSVLADIFNATSVYQAALFFEGLAQFVVGIQDQKLLKEFEKCKITLSP